MNRPFSIKGFTLVEIMVVVAIMGLLAAIVTASLSNSRTRTYDAKRKADLKELQGALEAYYQQNGSYPATLNNEWWGHAANAYSKSESGSEAYIPNLTPTYLGKLPQDPKLDPTAAGGWGGAYLYRSDGTSYKLLAHAPIQSDVGTTPTSDPFYDPARPTWAWMVCSGEPACSSW